MADKLKRPAEDTESNEDAEEWVGPMPEEASKPKKQKVLEYEKVFLEHLPSSETYEKSFMHRDVVTHLIVAKTNFILTASCDGHVKFWAKCEGEGIEFVKHFRSHLGTITDLAASADGELACSVSDDKTAKVFDVVNFDMINMIKIGITPQCCCWTHYPGATICTLAIADKNSPKIYLFDGRGTSEPLHVLDKLHMQPVLLIKYNSIFDTAISVDQGKMLEYWSGSKNDYAFPKNVDWEYKTDTDLYEFAKCNTLPCDMAISPNGKFFATICKDRKVRVFKFLTGKLYKVIDESLKQFTELQQMKQQLPSMEFGRRLAAERDLEKSDAFNFCNIVYDESGNFILYSTMLGIKVVNLYTDRCARILGKPENARFLKLALFQGSGKKSNAAATLEMEASDNPSLVSLKIDPILICSAFKKNRFYLFTKRGAFDARGDEEKERDVFNEKPSKEDMVAASQDTSYTRVAETATIHTTFGDVGLELFPRECPKTVENFCVHSRNGYFNGHIIHRVIKGFMIQTGDPLGNGTGGESIWGGEFEDEFHKNLRHDRPYTLSMANAGPNTNGSQFFITLAQTPWLDNKHTVFGRANKGLEVIQKIGMAKTNAKTDKPYDDIQIISVTIR